MGNNICCEQTRTQGTFDKQDLIIKRNITVEHKKVEEKPHTIPEPPTKKEPQPQPQHKPAPPPQLQSIPQEKPVPQEIIDIPDLTLGVKGVLTKQNFFADSQRDFPYDQRVRYGGDVYVGYLDDYGVKPNGFGKMYKEDRSLYVGYFAYGKAHGKGAYIFPDGSYYHGDFNNNYAQSPNGQFWSPELHYVGGFKQNTFEGKGTQRGKDYVYEGQFKNGARTRGILTWNNGTHSYNGTFNGRNKFQGTGELKEPEGIYIGDFADGLKQGKGTYIFSKGSKYQGTYSKGQRQGYGTIYHGNGLKAYEGQMRNGLPHGKGKLFSKQGKQSAANWIDGIDVNLLPKS